MPRRACFSILFFSVTALAADRSYTVNRYSADITLDFVHHSIKAAETIHLQASERQIELDANEIVIDSVAIAKRAIPFSQTPGHVLIELPKVGPATLTLDYHGSPAKGVIFSNNEAFAPYNTSHWLVVNHLPSDLATIHLRLHTPANVTVISNGDKRSIPDFVMGFAVGPFAQADERSGKIALRYLSTKYTSVQLAQIFRLTPQAMQFFEAKSGVPYPSRTYSQVMVSGDPEQELGDFTLLPNSYGETLLAHPEEAWLLAHELAHQWWGIGIACRDWSDVWLNEGIATFMADVFLGEQFGLPRYQHEIDIAQQIYEKLKAAGKDHALSYRGKGENEVGGRLPYMKGAWVLHLLKQRMGDDAFWHGLQIYTRTNWGRTVTSEDFQAAMQRASASDLTAFFTQWVYR